MELAKVRELVGHKLVLIGNLDVSRLLVRGTREAAHRHGRYPIAV